nr:hypothetical protein [Deltaproteobacteria bacterium]
MDRRYAYVDTGGSRNDYVRMWLASYRFGDVNECVYLARHSSDFDARLPPMLRSPLQRPDPRVALA